MFWGVCCCWWWWVCFFLLFSASFSSSSVVVVVVVGRWVLLYRERIMADDSPDITDNAAHYNVLM